MPFANPDILRTCRDFLLDNPDLDAVIPSTVRGMEPLHAVYRREPCLKAVKDAIKADQWKMISWHPNVNVRVLSPDETALLDPEGLAFANVNTLEEYKAAIRRMNLADDQ
jgi:molybdopterin-guanine dinucleotide biosynthesis protein A